MGKRRPSRFRPPLPGGGYAVGPVIEGYDQETMAGEPLAPVYEWDPETGMMKLMDPQPPHPFPEAAAAYAAAQAAKAATAPPAEPPQ